MNIISRKKIFGHTKIINLFPSISNNFYQVFPS